MQNDKWSIVVAVLYAIGGIFLIVFIVKLVLALINSTLVLSGFVLSVAGLVLNILAVMVGILVVIGATLAILAVLRELMTQFNLMMEKIDAVVRENLEKLSPILIASASQIFLILVSNDYAPGNTKVFLSVMIWILVGIILLAQARPEMKKRLPAILALIAVAIIVVLFVLIKYQIYSAEGFYSFFNLQWNTLLEMPLIDMLSILFVCFALLMLFVVFLYYHIRRRAMS